MLGVSEGEGKSPTPEDAADASALASISPGSWEWVSIIEPIRIGDHTCDGSGLSSPHKEPHPIFL